MLLVNLAPRKQPLGLLKLCMPTVARNSLTLQALGAAPAEVLSPWIHAGVLECAGFNAPGDSEAGRYLRTCCLHRNSRQVVRKHQISSELIFQLKA